MPFNSIDNYHDACRQQVMHDNANGVDCVYLPNTVFTDKPKYCLIAAEPSCSALGVAGMDALVQQGMTNFLMSHGDFILQMCAFEYLCNNRFDYIVTDLSKGAMPVEQAGIGWHERYVNWFPILQDELDFYANPTRISVGQRATDFLNEVGLVPALQVYHYSRQVNGLFVQHYNQHPEEQHFTAALDDGLRQFIELLFETIDYPVALRTQRLNALFRAPLTVSVKGMYLHYRRRFLNLIANN